MVCNRWTKLLGVGNVCWFFFLQNGCFIVRNSTRYQGEYSLSLYFNGEIKHLRIRRRDDGQFAVGNEKKDEKVRQSESNYETGSKQRETTYLYRGPRREGKQLDICKQQYDEPYLLKPIRVRRTFYLASY